MATNKQDTQQVLLAFEASFQFSALTGRLSNITALLERNILPERRDYYMRQQTKLLRIAGKARERYRRRARLVPGLTDLGDLRR